MEKEFTIRHVYDIANEMLEVIAAHNISEEESVIVISKFMEFYGRWRNISVGKAVKEITEELSLEYDLSDMVGAYGCIGAVDGQD